MRYFLLPTTFDFAWQRRDPQNEMKEVIQFFVNSAGEFLLENSEVQTKTTPAVGLLTSSLFWSQETDPIECFPSAKLRLDRIIPPELCEAWNKSPN